MKKHHAHQSYAKVIRLGSTGINDQVQSALANVTLEGLQPSRQSIELLKSVAYENMSADDAVQTVLRQHGCHA